MNIKEMIDYLRKLMPDSLKGKTDEEVFDMYLSDYGDSDWCDKIDERGTYEN